MLDDSCCFSVIETDHFIQDSVVQPYMVAHVLPETHNRQSVVCGTGSTVITGCMSRTTTIHMRRTGRSFFCCPLAIAK
jgi:hypothetical protein